MAVFNQCVTERYAAFHGDSCEVLPMLPSESVHLSIYSPPFCGLFHYSSSERDLSNARSYGEFFEHYEFIVREITRLTLPGRISAVHCMDVPKDGANICGHEDFPGDIIDLYQRLGWDYLPRISIWKEPLEVRNRTMAKALTHRQVVEDSTLTNVAGADYLLPFRKHGENPIPVAHPLGLTSYAGFRQMPDDAKAFEGWTGPQIGNKFSHWIWRQYASSIWDDIRLDRVLPFRDCREPDDEKHVHPLQLDVIERACVLWSNPGEVVVTPFAGVGSEVAGALMNGRKAIGIELKAAYYRQMLSNLEEVCKLESRPPSRAVEERSLFDLSETS